MRLPADYLAIYTNKNHAKLDFYRDHISTAKKLGYVTMFWNDMATNYPADYEERYRPFGFQCVTETVFCNQSGEVIGVFAGLKSAETAFSDAEMPAIRLMSPYIFYGFQRYRGSLRPTSSP